MPRSLNRISLLLVLTIPLAAGDLYERGKQLMVCHRMANRDVPENTLESLREAQVLGCDITEIDIWRTVDGELVLFHDGPIDRVSTGSGEVEKMLSSELALYDAGSWFSSRFAGIRHPRLVEALRFAKDSGIKLILDHKSKGITREVYELVKAEGMLDRVSIGGPAEDLAKLAPGLSRQPTASWQPGMTREQVARLQREGKFVVAGFSANDHELDLVMMRQAAAAGVDILNTDHPRLAADALGRSIEKRGLAFARQAQSGDAASRIRAVGKLAEFRDLPLTNTLSNLVVDPEPNVSRAAAIALVKRKDQGCLPVLIGRVDDNSPAHSVANIAWIAGMLASATPATTRWLIRYADATDPSIAMESLRAISRIDFTPIPKELLMRRLSDSNAMVRGAAARALARHVPSSASALIAAAGKLQSEIHTHWSSYAAPQQTNAFGKHRTTFERPAPTSPQAMSQIARSHELYRGYHNLLGALAAMTSLDVVKWLHEQALRTEYDFSGFASYVSATQLWDRAAPDSLAPGLTMDDPMRRDRVQWTLLKHGSSSTAALRRLLTSEDSDARIRAAQTLAWIGDSSSRSTLEKLAQTDKANGDFYKWCLAKLTEVEQLAQAHF